MVVGLCVTGRIETVHLQLRLEFLIFRRAEPIASACLLASAQGTYGNDKIRLL